jgi:hypothetical protein
MTLPDVRALLAALAAAEVDHVVIGGIALALHGHIRTTEDLDIVPDPDPANLDRLCRALEAEGAMLLLNRSRRFGDREAWMLRRGRNISLTTRFGDLDVVRNLAGVPAYESLLEDAERYDIDGIAIVVASPTKLKDMKSARGSAQDAADIEALRMLEGDERTGER